ncbi:hypothetical protein GCK32_014998 [Trichostrongylus colubriformis]|uniref:Uncharacterized protein n=1 Tax=Trichostrongylus colubriformis TaxID=6319 RepID=A0AAN8FYT8_TRICO
MAGVPVKLVGCAPLLFQIGSVSFEHTVYFTESACIPDDVEAYNIILGNDLLRRFPAWTIDYTTRTFSMAGQQLKILCASPAGKEEGPEQTIPIRIAETTVLPPSSETFVQCTTDSNTPAPLMLVSQNTKLTERSLMVTPAVITPG